MTHPSELEACLWSGSESGSSPWFQWCVLCFVLVVNAFVLLGTGIVPPALKLIQKPIWGRPSSSAVQVNLICWNAVFAVGGYCQRGVKVHLGLIIFHNSITERLSDGSHKNISWHLKSWNQPRALLEPCLVFGTREPTASSRIALATQFCSGSRNVQYPVK